MSEFSALSDAGRALDEWIKRGEVPTPDDSGQGGASRLQGRRMWFSRPTHLKPTMDGGYVFQLENAGTGHVVGEYHIGYTDTPAGRVYEMVYAKSASTGKPMYIYEEELAKDGKSTVIVPVCKPINTKEFGSNLAPAVKDD